MSNNLGALRALAREGLLVQRDGNLVSIRASAQPNGLVAEVLLPKDHPLDTKAIKQLHSFAQTNHPSGGLVHRALATPDFHPGHVVPVGCVLATSEFVIPAAIGTDIQCGMRLHVADLSVDELLARKPEWLKLVKGDLIQSTRDLPMNPPQIQAMFRSGPLGWLEESGKHPLGMLRRADHRQLQGELEQSFGLGSMDGALEYAPQDMLNNRPESRDCFIGTIGGGNHFVELQVVEEVLDRAWAFQWGIRKGQVAIMAHSGSRRVGIVVGQTWMGLAKERWPKDIEHPQNGIFALHGEAAHEYMAAMNTAANYGSVNRLLLAELVRDRLRQVFGRELEMPLVFDAPHNIVTVEHGLFVHRKGATPAYQGHPVLIPGSMGQASYLMVGHGNPRFLQSASHGAGRKLSRRDMGKLPRDQLGLEAVECITLKEERITQEAPAAYKDIEGVVQVQAEVGIASPVARLRPLVTFKG
jgi:tRNA-splicing ligase RtcB (3'-phosphate/5'-hydroxy nucleic acid ligase)